MITLFDEPFDLDRIEKLLDDEAFLSLAHLTIGRQRNWRPSLDQTVRLLSAFEKAGRDSIPVFRIASMLVQRTGQLPGRDSLLLEATTKLGLLPDINYAQSALHRSP